MTSQVNNKQYKGHVSQQGGHVTTLETEHEDMIHDAQLDHHAHHLATCSSDCTVKIYQIIEGTGDKDGGSELCLVADLHGHEGPVWQVAWAHPMFGKLLASCSYDRRVILWKDLGVNDFRIIFNTQHHDSSVNSICWAPREYGLMLACGASDGVVSIISKQESDGRYKNDGLWNVKQIPHAHSVMGCNAVSWAHPIKTNTNDESKGLGTNIKYKKRIVSGGCDNLVKIWIHDDINNKWIEEDTLDGHSDWVRDVAFAPNCGLPTSVLASCSIDGRVIIWKKNEHDENGPYGTSGPCGTWSWELLNEFNMAIWHLSWSALGDILAVSGAENHVSLWKEKVGVGDGWVCISNVEKGILETPPSSTRKMSKSKSFACHKLST